MRVGPEAGEGQKREAALPARGMEGGAAYRLKRAQRGVVTYVIAGQTAKAEESATRCGCCVPVKKPPAGV